MGGAAPIDLLYRLTQRDQAFPHWGPAQGRVVRTEFLTVVVTTEAEFDAVHLAPAGTILFLTAILAVGIPSSGKSVFRVMTDVVRRTTDELVAQLNFRSNRAPEINQEMAPQTPVDYALDTDRFYLRCSGLFGAAPVTGTIELNWTGYIVPRGEIGFT